MTGGPDGVDKPRAGELAADFTIAFAAVAAITIAAGATAPEGETRDWRAYLASGTLFPLLIVLINFLPLPQRARKAALWIAIVITTLAGLFLFIEQGEMLSLAAAGVVLAIAGELRGRTTVPPQWGAIGVAWLAASSLIWWWHPIPQLIGRYWLAGLAAAAVAGLHFCRGRDAQPSLAARVTAIAVPILFFEMATRADRLENFGALHHWSFIVGPAELLRRHGLLLWDLPSQYGFLSTLSIAAVPAPNRFQALYSINVVLLTLCATFGWYVLQLWRSDLLGRLLSIVIAAAAFFLVPGSALDLTGPMEYPSIGPFRFLWVYALLALLLWNFRTDGRHSARVQLAGGALWAIGCLWAFESLAYVTSIWVPAAVLLALDAWQRGTPVRRAVLRLLAGPFVFAAALAIIDVVYRVRLGHGPDYRAFWEYSLAYSGPFGTIAAEPLHPWIAVALVLALGAAVASPLIRTRDYLGLSLIAGSWGAMWATTSYYAARSHPNNITNIAPIALTATVCIMLVGRARNGESRPLLAMIAAALPAFLLMIPMVEYELVGQAFHASLQGYDTNVAARFPAFDPALSDLFARAGVCDDDPLAFIGAAAAPFARQTENGRTLYRTRPSLIPAIPSILLDVLPQPRRLEILNRYMSADTTTHGWLVRGRGNADMRTRFDGRMAAHLDQEDQVFINEMLRYYRVTGVAENARWQLARLERRPVPQARR